MKILFTFWQMKGGEELLEKCRVIKLWRPERGLRIFGHVSDRFRILFRVLQTVLRVKLLYFRGQFRSAGVLPVP